MAFLSFNEKAWDKIRPSSVKKTGVSEAIRAFEKAGPGQLKDLTTLEDCTAASDLIETIASKLGTAKGKFDAKKNADAVKTVTSWLGELTDRKKMIELQSGKITKAGEDAVAEAGRIATGYHERAEKLRDAGQDFLDEMQGLVKRAVIAGAKADTGAFEKIDGEVSVLMIKVDKLVQGVTKGRSDLKSDFSKAIPKGVLLSDKQGKIYEKADMLQMQADHEFENIEYSRNDFTKAAKTIADARKSGVNSEAEFVKIVEADVKALRDLISKVGSSDTGAAVDIEGAEEALERAKKAGPEEKQKHLDDCRGRLTNGLKWLKLLDQSLANAVKSQDQRTKGYPNFVNDKNDAFTELVGQLKEVKSTLQKFEASRTKAAEKSKKVFADFQAASG